MCAQKESHTRYLFWIFPTTIIFVVINYNSAAVQLLFSCCSSIVGNDYGHAVSCGHA